MDTVTVTSKRSKFTVEFSRLPGQTFGPWTLVETIQDLTVSALLSPVDARDLVLSAAVTGSATTETGDQR